MKILLASLMCLVLTAAQCFALKGGPPYPGTGARISGSYAGVLVPAKGSGVRNTLGLFTVAIPQTGGSAGAVVMFVDGQVFVGEIAGIADPNKSSLTGVIATSRTSSLTLCTAAGTPISQEVTDHANARLEAKIRTTPQAAFTVSGTLLIGTAVGTATMTTQHPSFCNLTVENSTALRLLVDGFKQSTN